MCVCVCVRGRHQRRQLVPTRALRGLSVAAEPRPQRIRDGRLEGARAAAQLPGADRRRGTDIYRVNLCLKSDGQDDAALSIASSTSAKAEEPISRSNRSGA